MKAEYDKQGQTVIINLTILECKLDFLLCYLLQPVYNKSNHIGM